MRSNIFPWISLLISIILIGSCLISAASAAGKAVTEGDILLKTKDVREILPNDGKGIIVGVISDGADNYAQAVQSGDLPDTVKILSSQCKSSKDEGTAILEIVHDIAPGATLLFHDFGCGGDTQVMGAYDALVAAGADIIVSDFESSDWPFFEDNAVSLHLSDLMEKNPNLILIASAGNLATKHYQAEFSRQSGGTHSFSGETGIPADIQPKGKLEVVLQWDDPYNSPENEYELHLVDRDSGEVVGVGKRDISQRGRAYQRIQYGNYGKEEETEQLEIQVWADDDVTARNIELFIGFTNLVSVDNSHLIPADSIYGISATPGIITVAACKPTEPEIQGISSRGTITISHPSATTRQKPDITAPDTVSVSGAGGFGAPVQGIFEGTSASAPHIAGLIALLWSNFSDLSADQVKEALFSTATDLGNPGWDEAYGHGLANAEALSTYLEVTYGEPKEPVDITPPDITVPPTEVPAEASSGITRPVVITTPGSYSLTNDITDTSEVIIEIACSGVTLDGSGHVIKGRAFSTGMGDPIFQTGVLVHSSLSDVTLQNLRISDAYNGIMIDSASDITISGSTLDYTTNGIVVQASDAVQIDSCTIRDSGNSGIILESGTTGSQITTSEIYGGINGIDIDGSSKNEVSSNSIQGALDSGILLEHDTSAITIQKNTFSQNGEHGIDCISAKDGIISQNEFLNNKLNGIMLHGSTGNTIAENTFSGNMRGINIYQSDNNMIQNNEFTANRGSAIMFQPSAGNVVSGNLITQNRGQGIFIMYRVDRDSKNLIFNNYFSNDVNVGIEDGADSNYLYNIEHEAGENILDGNELGGNVWSSPSGQGFSQVCTDADNDGFCDTPYTANQVVDNLPLKDNGQMAGSEAVSAGIVTSVPQTADDWTDEGVLLRDKGDYLGAIAAFDTALALNPAHEEALRNKALAYAKLGMMPEAIAAIDVAISQYPDSVKMIQTKGDFYLVDMKEYEQAVAAYEQALLLDSKDVHTLINMAFALTRLGDTKRAFDLYTQVLDIQPDLADAWSKAGNILYQNGDYENALKYHQKSTELNPNSALFWYNTGLTLLKMGNYADAAQMFQNSLMIDPQYESALKGLEQAQQMGA